MLLFALLTLLALAASAQTPTERFSRVAGQLQAAMNADDQPGIQKLFAPAMVSALPPDKSSEFFRGLVRDAGKVIQIAPPRSLANPAVLRMTFERGQFDLTLTLDSSDKIIGLFITPSVPDLPVPERNATTLHLPFGGAWLVHWGGATEAQNYHVVSRAQRRALDLVQTDAQGKTHRGDGTKNTDYFCYGQPILAAGEGMVVMAVDGVPDNAPNKPNSLLAVGNCIVIQHKSDEFSVYAHLQPGSLRVKVGDTVTAGQTLGLCGNSGNSTEPHLHFHLQNTFVFADATGFAPHFQSVRLTRAGKTTTEADCSPVKGDLVQAGR